MGLSRLHPRARLWLNRLLIAAGALVAWELISGTLVATRWISEPSLIAAMLVKWISTGSIFQQVATTLSSLGLGLLLGVLLGASLGFLFGLQPLVRDVLEPHVVAFNSLPHLALTPLLILWFGIDLTPKVVLVAISAFFFVFINVMQAVRDVDDDLINIVTVMGATQLDLLYKVIMPSALTALFVGLKQAVPAGLRAAVLAEMMTGNWGLGATIRSAGQVFDSTSLFAAVFIVMVLGAVLNELVNIPEVRLLRWRKRVSDDQGVVAVGEPATVTTG